MAGRFDRSAPGLDNARDWLEFKILEMSNAAMDDQAAAKLADYYGALNALRRLQDERAAEGSYVPMTDEMAQEWTVRMQNEDGTCGPHWSMTQVSQIMAKRGVKRFDALTFWVALNMIYSDYVGVASKYGLNANIDFFVDLALAFLEDKDAKPGKLLKYYECVVHK